MVAGAVLSPHSTNGGLNSDKCRLVQGFFLFPYSHFFLRQVLQPSRVSLIIFIHETC